MATCDICGKVIKSTSAEAMAAHQRESSSCYPLTASASAPKAVRDAEEQLRAAIDESKRLAAGGGSFEEQERAVRERSSAVLALKRARQESRDAKKEIRDIAQASMSAQGWTDALRAGEEARFARAEGDAVESRLASETIGLVSASAFKQKRAEKGARDAASSNPLVRARTKSRRLVRQIPAIPSSHRPASGQDGHFCPSLHFHLAWPLAAALRPQISSRRAKESSPHPCRPTRPSSEVACVLGRC